MGNKILGNMGVQPGNCDGKKGKPKVKIKKKENKNEKEKVADCWQESYHGGWQGNGRNKNKIENNFLVDFSDAGKMKIMQGRKSVFFG